MNLLLVVLLVEPCLPFNVGIVVLLAEKWLSATRFSGPLRIFSFLLVDQRYEIALKLEGDTK